jgi:hypothetical protein
LFCAPGHVFGSSEGVESHFQVLCSRSRFRRYQGRRVLFTCFAHPDSFSVVPRASVPVFMFCAPRLIFGGAECVGSRFHVLRALTRVRRYRGRPFSFSCLPLPHMFLALRRASGPVFMFCAPGHVFDGSEGIRSRFHVLHAQTRFRRIRGRLLPFSCFAFPDSFSAVRRVSGPVSCFARPDSFSAVPRASGPVFMFCAPRHFFGRIEGVGSRFHVFHSRTRFRRYRGRRFSFSCFTLPDSFLVVSSASDPVFMFSAP